MTELLNEQEFRTALEDAIKGREAKNASFSQAWASGDLEREHFARWAENHYHYVGPFADYLGYIYANTPDWATDAKDFLLQNMYEEELSDVRHTDLLIRFADLMLSAPGVLAVLAMLGGFTALFGALVMLTQPAVKTSLAWSTVAQMGFMMLQCGLALFPLALLHIVAHSLYKAHAFLASGGAVEQVAAICRPGSVAVPDGSAVRRAFLIALAIYGAIGAGFGFAFGFEHKSPQAFALGAILIFGVAYLLAQGLADFGKEAKKLQPPGRAEAETEKADVPSPTP